MCPVVTGQDAEVASVKSIIAGEQTYTVFKDTRQLAAQTAKMVDQALKGETVDINDTKTYDNGVKVVPSYLLTPISIDINNYQKELVDSGYIKAEDLGVTAAPAAPAAAAKTYADMTLCFPQLGAESDWRTADTASFKETAQQLGIKQLVFSDAQQKQENQISAMRACIQQGVDVIALPPVVEDGWDAVLQEAKDAGIPVIIVDRSVSADPSMYAAHIGSDMELEGKKAGDEMNKLLPNGGNVLEISGTTGSGAAVGRAKGFRETLNANITILDSQTGNFNPTEAKPVAEAFLKKYAGQIDGFFIHNDGMAQAVVEAMKSAGIKPGDIKMVSVDGTRGGFQMMIDGWVQADVECNPLLGPQVMEMALKLMNGEPVDPETLTNETVYYPDNAAELLPSRQY
jgi:simple sugar transport system substrate-binding protein